MKKQDNSAAAHVQEVTPYLVDKRGSEDAYSLESDEAALAALGYRQEFKRSFTALEVFGIGFSVIGLFPSIASVLVYAIPYGGSVALVWGWAVCAFFLMFVAMALAELASAAPTSGGLYYWTWTFASPRWRNVLAWIVGYSNSMGLIAGVTSVDWSCAVQLMAAVSIGSNGSFAPTTGQSFAVFIAILFCHCLISCLATSIIARLQGVYVVLNILLCLAIVIALPAATPTELRNTPSYAFGNFTSFYSWPNGFAFILSFLAPLWTVGGFDAPVHISEEAANARTAVPWAIVSAVGLAGVLGFAINVAIVFCMGTDMEGIMSNPIGQPMATILFNALGRNGTLAIWSVVVLVQFLMGSSTLTTASRQVFAFARDGALPFSSGIYRINSHTQTPVNAVWASAFVALVLGLITLAGPAASSAIFSLGVAGQYIAFSIPIMCRFLGGKPWIPGPFSLGHFGMPVGAIAVAFMIFAVVIFSFPAAPDPGPQGMNYMVAVFGGWILLCIVYFYLPVYGGMYWFNGPKVTLEHAGSQVTTANTGTPDEEWSESKRQSGGSESKKHAPGA